MNLHDLKEAGTTQAAGGAALLLHPYVLFRLAGEPAAALKATSSGAPAELFQHYTSLRAELQPRAAALAGELEALVPRAYEANPADAKLLLQLKRDVFNLRPGKVAPDNLSAWLDASVQARIRQVQQSIEALQALEQRFQAAYDDDMAGARAALRTVFMGENIRQGMIYADVDMFRDLRRLFEQGEVPAKKKKEKILENTLMNYLVRTALKTSPMSAFTPILQGQWQAACGVPLRRSYPAWRLRTIAHVRKGLVHALAAPQLDKLPYAGRRYRIHPGLRDDGAALTLTDVTPWKAYWNAAISRRQVGRSPVLHVVQRVFADADGGVLSYEDIAPRLAAHLPARLHAGLPALVDKLIDGRMLADAGMLASFGEQEDSVAWAGSVLSAMPGSAASAVWQGLRQLDDAVRRHAEAQGDERIATAAAINDTVAGLQDKAALPERVTPAFYENCAFIDPQPQFDPALLAPVRAGVEWMLRLSPIFDAYGRYQTGLADRFIARYGEDGVCHDAAAFLEAIPDTMEARGAPIPNRLTEETTALRDTFNALLYARYRAGGDIALNDADLAPLAAAIPQQLRARTVSYSFHAQFFDCSQARHGMVVNKVYPGHSIMYSRFLDPAQQCDPAIHGYLSQLADSGHYLEVPGVFGLNTNLHPPLAQAELGLPAFPPNRLRTPQVALDSLTVHYERRSHRVVFRMADGANVDLLYFGMSVPYVLPRLHRILSAVNTQAGLTMSSELMKAVLQRDDGFDPQQVLRLPRLSLGGLVVSRRTVHVPAAHFPPAHEDEAAFFYGIQQWRAALDLPQEGYIQLAARPLTRSTQQVMQDVAQEAAANDKTQRWKPFYIDFSNPMLVRLLHRALRAEPGRLVFQEALPGSGDQWLEIAGRKHVAEVQFEASIKGQ